MDILKFAKEERTFLLDYEVSDWREAVCTACQVLEEKNYISPGYCQRIIANTLEYGPYYACLPNIALAHASAEGDVFRTGASVLVLKEPVNFNLDRYPEPAITVSAVITLASENDADIFTDSLLEILEKVGEDPEVRYIRNYLTEV
ncbi:PTS sugar transporter subunit IIA [Candidatus Haliotispira prima]|uniref:Ascorbate-specific PTS system EIIA component n=1 Tax=Candidatus Haliotispira prima TaxID=3034016 RepID=A0ABY8MEA6_9SPIO|nr:PTS sugar transporter subunit IIA [Candidatus Haliotispira prima]